jgi:hypothetical protein
MADECRFPAANFPGDHSEAGTVHHAEFKHGECQAVILAPINQFWIRQNRKRLFPEPVKRLVHQDGRRCVNCERLVKPYIDRQLLSVALIKKHMVIEILHHNCYEDRMLTRSRGGRPALVLRFRCAGICLTKATNLVSGAGGALMLRVISLCNWLECIRFRCAGGVSAL